MEVHSNSRIPVVSINIYNNEVQKISSLLNAAGIKSCDLCCQVV